MVRDGMAQRPAIPRGFILDMCVHNFALLRQLLGSGNPIVQIAAMGNQNQQHLPPVDTINAAIRLQDGTVGSLCMSFSSRRATTETSITYEHGYIEMLGGYSHIRVVDRTGKVLYEKDYSEISEAQPCRGELAALIKSIQARIIDPMLDPQQALIDLHCVCHSLIPLVVRHSIPAIFMLMIEIGGANVTLWGKEWRAERSCIVLRVDDDEAVAPHST